MKHRIITLILLLSVMQISWSCKKTESEKLIGTWRWVRSEGGICYHVLTPQSTGQEKLIKILPNDTIEEYVNGKLSGKAEYSVKTESGGCYSDTFKALIVRYKYRITNPDSIVVIPVHYLILTLSDSLVLQEDICDGYRHTYIRE